MRLPTLGILLATVLTVSACGGGGGGESEEDQVRDTVQQLVDNDVAVCDKMTPKFIKARFDGKKSDCVKASKEKPVKATISRVSVDGEKASARAKNKDGTYTLGLVDDGGWKLDSVKSVGSSSQNAASGNENASTGTQDDASVKARAGAEAFLTAIRQGDANVFCGLLDENFARKLLSTDEFGVAKCVEIFGKDKSLLQTLRRRLGDSTTVERLLPFQLKDKKTGVVEERKVIVALSNGTTITLREDDGRYVVDRIRN